MNLKCQVNSNVCCQVSCPDLGLVTVVMHRITYATASKAFPSMDASGDRSVQCSSRMPSYPISKKAKQAQHEQHGASTRVKIISLIFTAVLKVMGRPCPSRYQGQIWGVWKIKRAMIYGNSREVMFDKTVMLDKACLSQQLLQRSGND